MVSSGYDNDNQFLEICYNIHALINEYNVGKYRYGNTNIEIRNKVLNNPPLNVENPKFDMDLLEIS